MERVKEKQTERKWAKLPSNPDSAPIKASDVSLGQPGRSFCEFWFFSLFLFFSLLPSLIISQEDLLGKHEAQ